MELFDQLLEILAGPNPRLASQQLQAAGHTEDEVRELGTSPGLPAGRCRPIDFLRERQLTTR